MSLSPIDRIGSTPYRIDDLRTDPLYRSREAARLARAEATGRFDARVDTVQPKPVTIPAPDVPSVSVDLLRDTHADETLHRAVQAYRDEQAQLQARADNANNLSDIDSLMELQQYRVAMANPPLNPAQLAAAAGMAPAVVAPVTPVLALRSTTDDALANDPAVRARANRPRGIDA
ncbi:hypothetical protein CEK29_20320 [Bordetella genomosp. 5]|uniref:hypothetical protein n=1 Tax=Bordetella genomosp. 5 TaxID=1395608 RepID=UPI000B9EEA09|nr:hypothetical protein [Bordetella genomosp. 5]OZI38847.1 hypothetical protein CEK29_20320 [Bordetella genomosp. 5]